VISLDLFGLSVGAAAGVAIPGTNATIFARRPVGVRGKRSLAIARDGLSDTGPLGIRRLEGDRSAGWLGLLRSYSRPQLRAVIQEAVGNPLRAGRI